MIRWKRWTSHLVVFGFLGMLFTCPAFAVQITISKSSLELDPSQRSGQVRLISGGEALEYDIELIEKPQNGGELLWAPRSLIVPPQTSVPLRFAYRPESFGETGTYEYAFRIRAQKAENTAPLRELGENANNDTPQRSGTSAQVTLAPALRFRVTINHTAR